MFTIEDLLDAEKMRSYLNDCPQYYFKPFHYYIFIRYNKKIFNGIFKPVMKIGIEDDYEVDCGGERCFYLRASESDYKTSSRFSYYPGLWYSEYGDTDMSTFFRWAYMQYKEMKILVDDNGNNLINATVNEYMINYYYTGGTDNIFHADLISKQSYAVDNKKKYWVPVFFTSFQEPPSKGSMTIAVFIDAVVKDSDMSNLYVKKYGYLQPIRLYERKNGVLVPIKELYERKNGGLVKIF